jgi:hypothetical protein
MGKYVNKSLENKEKNLALLGGSFLLLWKKALGLGKLLEG